MNTDDPRVWNNLSTDQGDPISFYMYTSSLVSIYFVYVMNKISILFTVLSYCSGKIIKLFLGGTVGDSSYNIIIIYLDRTKLQSVRVWI